MSTKFKELIEYLQPDKKDRDEAILRYFDNEDDSEFEIRGKFYYVFNYGQVIDLLRHQYEEDCDSFKQELKYNDFQRIVENIDFDIVIENLLDLFKVNELFGYSLLDNSKEYYIYEEN